VLLADQDRSLWDRDAIAEAAAIMDPTLRRRSIGPYQLQAAIACLHGAASSFDETDWAQIVVLYRHLEDLAPTAVVRVNRAVAEAQVAGPQRGLALLDTVEGADGWHLWWSARADFLRRLDRPEDAAAAYRRALECSMNDSDRRFLERRLVEVTT
jgi:RNA polymerase sigma-70 factor (ECF subfamily)